MCEYNSSGTLLKQFTWSSYPSSPSAATVAIDKSGNTWTTWGGTNVIGEYNSSYTFLGSVFIDSPNDIQFDSSGNLWISGDCSYICNVSEYNTSGTLLSSFGSAGSGNGQFNAPSGIAIDSSGNFWVLDSGNSRVQKFNSSGVYQSQFGSSGSGNGQFTFLSSNGHGAVGPFGIAISSR